MTGRSASPENRRQELPLIPTALRDAAHRLHVRVLGTGMGERTRSVLRGTGWVVSGALMARVVTGVTSLLAARWLGPEAWGRASLALAATLWLQVTLLFGLPAALLNSVPRADPAERRAWTRTGLVLLAATSSSTLLIAWLGRGPLARALGVDEAELRVALGWCAGFAIHAVASAALAAHERFRARAAAEVAFAAAFAACIAALQATGRLTWGHHVTAMGVSYGVVGLAAFAAAGVLPGWDAGFLARARRLLGYGAIMLGSSVAIALMQATARVIARRSFGDGEAGVLSAYQGGSVQLAAYLGALLTVVFFPVASRTPDRPELLRKMLRLLLPLVGASTLLFAGVLTAWMALLGKGYPLRPAPVLAFAAAAGLTVGFAAVAWLLASGGTAGAVAASITWLASGLVNAIGCLVLVPALGTLGAGIAAAIACAAGIGFACLHPLRRMAGLA